MLNRRISRSTIFNKNGICYIKSVLKSRIKILKIGWDNISKAKHPELDGKITELIRVLQNPTQIWQSKIDKQVKLYYLKINKKYFCAICRHYNKQGFLITAYYTYKIKGNKKLWPKK